MDADGGAAAVAVQGNYMPFKGCSALWGGNLRNAAVFQIESNDDRSLGAL